MSDTENSATIAHDPDNVMIVPIPNPSFTSRKLELFSTCRYSKDAAREINKIIVNAIKETISNGFDEKFRRNLISLIEMKMYEREEYFSRCGAFDSEPQWEIQNYCEKITNAFSILYRK